VRRIRPALTVLTLFLWSLAAFAQAPGESVSPAADENTPAGQLVRALHDLVEDLKSNERDAASRRIRVSPFRIIRPIGLALTARFDQDKAAVLSRGEFAKQLEEARIDKQVGSSSSADSSTSLVTKGAVPAVLGFAVENGAATQTQSGTVVTFRLNPVGFVGLLAQQNFLSAYDQIQAEAATRYLNRFSVALSFDLSREQSSAAPVFSGSARQLSAVTAHYDIVNKRDPRDPYFSKEWQSLVHTRLGALPEDLSPIAQAFLQDAVLQQWARELQDQVASAKDSDLEQVVAAQFEKLRSIPLPSTVESAVKSYNTDYAAFITSRAQLLRMVARGPLLSFEYTNNFAEPGSNLPDVSAFQVIGETGLFAGQADLTANFSAHLYNNTSPAVTHRLKDIDFSTAIEIPLTDARRLGNFTLSGSYKYRRLFYDSLDAQGAVLVPKGVMSVGQIQLTIPVKGSGVKVPLSVTFANRTEFIKESEVRGNIGITFDLDTLFANLAKP
jgi:hypothetical protein